MKEKMTIKISPVDANKALVKGIKAISREHAKAGRSLVGQVIESKKGGGEKEKKYPKHMHIEDLDEEELEELREKLKAEQEEEEIF